MSRFEKIRVALRLRPADEESVWACNDTTVSLLDFHKAKLQESKCLSAGANTTFQFGDLHSDRCFPPSASTPEIYSTVVHGIVAGCKDGFSGSVLAYGQTGSGKTYLMRGDSDSQGVVQLALGDLLTQADAVLTCSLFELYNEQVFDLLASEGNKALKVKEDPVTGFFVQDLREVECRDFGDVQTVLDLGEQRRHYAATRLNHHSSRAHCLLRVATRTTSKSRGVLTVSNSTLHFVDLAGSERLSLFKDTTDDLTAESRHINRSLFYLCQVITRLSEPGAKAHVPYRNSALTKILRAALGGSARTVIVCTAVAGLQHFEMTLSTLRFGAKARCIDNQVVADRYVETCDGEGSAGEFIEQLKDDLRRVREERDVAILRISRLSPPALGLELVTSVNIEGAETLDAETATDCFHDAADLEYERLKSESSELLCLTLKRELEACEQRLQQTQLSLKSVKQRHVSITQRRCLTELAKASLQLHDSEHQLNMIMTGAGLRKLAIVDLRRLEITLFHAIDRVKVKYTQEARISGRCAGSSTSEGSDSDPSVTAA